MSQMASDTYLLRLFDFYFLLHCFHPKHWEIELELTVREKYVMDLEFGLKYCLKKAFNYDKKKNKSIRKGIRLFKQLI